MAELRKMITMRLPQELLDRCDEWCELRRPPTTRTALIEMLLTDHLEKEGRLVAPGRDRKPAKN